MILFYGGDHSIKVPEIGERLTRTWSGRLLSCYPGYFPTPFMDFIRDAGPDWKHKTFMFDSGAFTAWVRGQKLTVEQLIDLYSRALEILAGRVGTVVAVNLDVIPGTRSQMAATERDKQLAIDESDRNFEVLKRRFGSMILPVFHFGETEERLKVVLEQNPEFICLSPRVGNPTQVKLEWSRRILSRVPKTTKVHGLAATAFEILLKVPWYSADSASWLRHGGYGNLVYWNNGAPNFIRISDRSPFQQKEDEHINTVSPVKRQRILDEIESRGWNVDDLRRDYRWVHVYNCETYELIREHVTANPPPLTDSQITLFDL